MASRLHGLFGQIVRVDGPTATVLVRLLVGGVFLYTWRRPDRRNPGRGNPCCSMTDWSTTLELFDGNAQVE
jgi:hypothetical protein